MKKIKKTLLSNKNFVLNLRLLNQMRFCSEILTHGVTVALRFLVPPVKVRILVGQLQIKKTLQVIGEFFCLDLIGLCNLEPFQILYVLLNDGFSM